MNVFSAIRTRRSIGVVKPDPVPKEMIEQILESGTWAPNHHRTEPWRFFVVTGEARRKLGEAISNFTKSTMETPISEENSKRLEREAQKPFRAPVIIAVAVEPMKSKKVLLKEEFAAVHAAVQNMLLVAHALGLGSIWRSGDVCYSQEIKQLFGLGDESEMVGFIYLGYPENRVERKGTRKHFTEKTSWFNTVNDFSK